MSAYSRKNNASSATVDRSRIFASGTFKNVWRGTYTVGAREGEDCVCKEFKTGSVYEDSYFDEELKVVRRAQTIIDDWNRAGVIRQTILLNDPQIWVYEDTGHKTLVEPFIENFEKFNSNTGWAPITGDAWSDAMQALSHFSYHNAGGQLLLCDLQGGMYRDGYVLSDPVVMSQTQTYGPADLGPDGIRSFFQRHRCNRFCRNAWTRPRVTGQARFPMRQGTTMVAPPSHGDLPTRRSRNPLTSLPE
ncbi:protein kinase-like domain-containing protein [Xylariomycetidae sp. FL2044]|nr:protein kinase-like domain-containing protein [Xylariomycetidae sp. FL2044]